MPRLPDFVIRIEQLSKSFVSQGRNVQALRDISLEIHDGEVFGIIGRSGAGKSTLVRTLNLLERPSAGRIHVDGEDITALDAAGLRRLRQRVGMVFQHFNLLSSKTVAENVAFPLRLAGQLDDARIDARVAELLELVGLSNQRGQYPAQLSGGQKQRVGIARALANHPTVLLCDEATSALDPETTQSILALLKDIHRRLSLTIVLITHEMDVIRSVCDRVAILERGELVECGAVADVFLFPRHALTRGLLAHDREALRGARAPLLRLTALDAAAQQPLLAELGAELGVAFNIVQGAIGRIQGRAYGQIVIELPGEVPRDKLEAALARRAIRHEPVQAPA